MRQMQRNFILGKYFNSQFPERANYANVPFDTERQPHIHTRSHSQHHYHQANNYYNVSNVEPNLDTPRNICIPPMHDHCVMQEGINALRILEVCNELGSIDTAAPIPPRRNYTICSSRDHSLYKLPFPQHRYTTDRYIDPHRRIIIPARSPIVVIGPSEDRSKFSICFNDQHLDIPHHLTQVCLD